MRKLLEKQEIQKICIGILKFIKHICDENDIKYYLAFGTCLGAVRHHGFIPWDDDIDIYMLREDYKKFSKLMSTKYSNSRYKLYYYNITPEYQQPLPKVCDTQTELIETSYKQCPIGVYVDVFILDRVPENITEQQKFFGKIIKMQTGWNVHYTNPSFIIKKFRLYKFIKYIVKLLVYPNYSPSCIDQYCQKYNDVQTPLLANLTEPCYSLNKITIMEGLLGEGKHISFEGEMYRVPEKTHEYLSQIYGNYMELPPVDQRVYHYSNKSYLK